MLILSDDINLFLAYRHVLPFWHQSIPMVLKSQQCFLFFAHIGMFLTRLILLGFYFKLLYNNFFFNEYIFFLKE